MKAPRTPRDPRARAIEYALWAVLTGAILTVVMMTWHPWVIGERSHCPAGLRADWDGRCRPT